MTIQSEELVSAVRNDGYHVGEMNDDQLYYFLVNKATRNVLQIEYPSDIDEFNRILGTSEGKGSLLKDLGIILSSEVRVFKNPENKIKLIKEAKVEEVAVVQPAKEKKTTKKAAAKKKPADEKPMQVNLFAGLFD